MSEKIRLSSKSVWESEVGYSRVVRMGSVVEVSGTTAVDEEGTLVGKNDPYLQAHYIFSKIEKYLKMTGTSMNDVIKTRMYVINIEHWQEVGRAHAEFFGEIKPAATMVEVSRLIDPDLLVEIEVTAIINNEL